MKLNSLQLVNFRNYDDLQLSFADGLTILTGENAQGKTNLLEAIFLLSLAKSHRTNHDVEMIQWNEDDAFIRAEVDTKNYSFPLELQLNKKGKIAKFNHLEQAKLSHFIGKLNVVLFAPEDLQLIKGSPSVRRKFIDSELGQSHPVYLQDLLEYNRILKQRNRYLKETWKSSKFDPIYFEVITDQLIEKAVSIIRYRNDFIKNLDKLANEIHYDLSNKRDNLHITYNASSSKLDYSDVNSLADQLKTLFQSARQREREQSVTVYGPHRDDLTFYINDKDAKNFASQGQQRTIVLSIKLAEIELLNDLLGEYPILLLDDVLSELDDSRQHILMSRIEGKIQTFLTTATIEGLNLEQLEHAQIYRIKQGQVSQER